MTTIAWRGRVLAADTQLTMGDDSWTFTRKLVPIRGGGCLTVAGDAKTETLFKAWLSKGAKIEDFDKKVMKKFTAIYVDREKNIWWYDNSPGRILISHQFHAVGTGEGRAMAAMHLGATAKEAILFASETDVNTNAYIDTYDLQTNKVTLCKWPTISRSRWEKMRVE
jgi:hypothetical protein